MSKEREAEIQAELVVHKETLCFKLVRELLGLRYERYKEQLVDREDNTLRGQARELKELKKIFM